MTKTAILVSLLWLGCALVADAEIADAPRFRARIDPRRESPSSSVGKVEPKSAVAEPKGEKAFAPKAQSLKIRELEFREFSEAPLKVQEILREASVLVEKNLPYKYGVADPERGFDCSGFVFYVLKENKARNVPRQANMFHQYVVDKSAFRSLRSDPNLEDLEPGDLLFWSGTYKIDRNITHVMFYLGKDRKTGERWMIGASNAKRGINAFTFNPKGRDGLGKNFVGYGKLDAFFPEKR